jgi:hypothetical protein
MSIPLDKLYHYIDDITSEIRDGDTIIYRFWPHGSKNIENLTPLKPTPKLLDLYPYMYCHDQEPLDYERYENIPDNDWYGDQWAKLLRIVKEHNLPVTTNLRLRDSIYDHVLLVHSELRSNQVELYRSKLFIPIYYWCHAIIALDWFRYAEHVTQRKQVEKKFLIYNRAWSGTREYRLKFIEHLIRLGLEDQCHTSVNPIEPELNIHYDLHTFKNPAWRPQTVLENFFPVSTAHSHYSADFDIEDYEATDIEVVLETLFDDSRLHLTEKSLRPIACGQPFILAGTQGSLEYLRSYGFKTFGHIWDERYDECANPEERLDRIADLMKQIANWMPRVRERKMAEVQAIAEYNKQHFFSEQFFNKVTAELKNNLMTAFDQLENNNTGTVFLNKRKAWVKHQELKDAMLTCYSRQEIAQVVKEARKYYRRISN